MEQLEFLDELRKEMPEFYEKLLKISESFSAHKKEYETKFGNIGNPSDHISVSTKEEEDGGLLITLTGIDEIGKKILEDIEQ